MKSRRSEPTTTHFAILGMLAIRPYSPYELANLFDRTLGNMWPRARSKLFEAPKQLVELGFARASAQRTGRRRKTVYAITPKGRRALKAWLQVPGEGPVVEFEQLVKIFYAEHGTKSGVLANIDAAAAWANERLARDLETGRAYAEGRGPYQHRAAQLVLLGGFLARFRMLVDDWAQWARPIVEGWPDDPAEAEPELEWLRDLSRQIERRQRARGRGA